MILGPLMAMAAVTSALAWAVTGEPVCLIAAVVFGGGAVRVVWERVS